MKQINNVNYIYNQQGEVSHAVVTYTDGSTETVSSKSKILEVQTQLKFQAKQFLVE
jgi:hypothetical protein